MQAIRTYTRGDLEMNVDGKKYILPFSSDVSDNDIVQKVVELFQKVDISERRLYKELYPDEETVVCEYRARSNTTKIIMKGVYSGYSESYQFLIVMELFRFKSSLGDDISRKAGDGQWMVALSIEQEESDLLEELIDLNVMPNVKKEAGLTKY
jgi:hypothetical protein